MGFFGKIFTWWNGATVSTAFNSMLSGEKVGSDAQGNRYFRAKKRYPKGHPFAGRERRWVIYNGEMEASRVSPDWHGQPLIQGQRKTRVPSLPLTTVARSFWVSPSVVAITS